MNENKQNVWVIIPAAGFGSRMNQKTPKQYLKIRNKTILQHTIEKFEALTFITGIIVAVAKNDSYFKQLDLKIKSCVGGDQRSDSILKALQAIEKSIDDNDWVMVHDAARPCVKPKDIITLYQKCQHHSVGGILAYPVKDTLKKSSQKKNSQKKIKRTINRENIWHALTPQMFRYKALKKAILDSKNIGKPITDDASAFENLGFEPLLVDGSESNIKITRPADLAYAKWLMENEHD